MTLTRLIRVAGRLGSLDVGDTQARLELRTISNDPALLTRAAAQMLSKPMALSTEHAVHLLGVAGADLELAAALAESDDQAM